LVFNRKQNTIRKTIMALASVKRSINRLDVLMDKITTRRTKLLEMAVQLEARGETFLARKYASEAARLDSLYSKLAGLKLVLEKIAISLEYALSMNTFNEIASNIVGIVSELKKLPEASIPEVGLMLTDIEYAVRELEEARLTPDYTIELSSPTGQDVEKILEEAREIVRKRLELELHPNHIQNNLSTRSA